MSTAVDHRLVEIWETPKTLRGPLGTVEHKEIGHKGRKRTQSKTNQPQIFADTRR